jgi:succinyl-CoA:acetate CoA-transferase
MDIHLSHVAQLVDYGFLGKMDTAIIEVTAILEDGRVVPSSSLGNNTTWINRADKIILEVNSDQPLELEGMHDIYYGLGLPPNRTPIPLLKSDQRIGTPYLKVPMEKVIAVVCTDIGDRASPFKAPDEASRKIAGHIINFLDAEVKKGHMPSTLFPLQSGVGNIANAVLFALEAAPFEGMTAYTEVIQDGMVHLLDKGKLASLSATAFSLSPEGIEKIMPRIGSYRNQIVIRQQEISNNPEIIRRLGVIAMNAMIEGDIYGNVNSTHMMGSSMQNGIGGSGDFTRNAYISFMMAPSSRWCRTSTTPSTISRSWSPTRGWQTCADVHPNSGHNSSLRTVRTPTSVRRCATTTTVQKSWHLENIRLTFSTSRCPGTLAFCARGACWPRKGMLNTC